MADSVITKKAIADAVKELTRKKPFDKISVGEITDMCGLNRQTFYYHFQDKYELLSWIYYQEAFLPIMDGISFENWDDRIYQLFDLMKREKYFYVNTIKYASNYFQEYLMKISETILDEAIDAIDVIGEVGAELGMDADDRALIVRFYAYGVCGTVVQWATTGMKMEPRELANHMKQLAISSERAAQHNLFSEAVEKKRADT